MRQELLVLVAAACVAAPLAAAAPSPAAYRTQMTSLCAQAIARADAVQPSDSASRAQVATALRRLAAIVDTLVRRLRRLDPPPSVAALHVHAVDVFRREVVLFRAMEQRVARGASLAAVRAGPIGKRGDRLREEGRRVFNSLDVPSCAV